jgi:hypothetical protein
VATPQLGRSAFADVIEGAKRGESALALQKAVADIIDLLQCLNGYNQSAAQRAVIFSPDVVYAISGIMQLGLETTLVLSKGRKESSALLAAIWRIGCAWDAVLAGDIEDIPQHVEYETAARQIW